MLPELLKTMMFTGVFTLGILSFLYALRWKASFMPHLSKRARILILVVYCLLMLLLFFSASTPPYPASGRPDHTAGLAQRLDAHPRIVGRIDFPSIYYTGTKVESLRPCPDFFAQRPKGIPQSTWKTESHSPFLPFTKPHTSPAAIGHWIVICLKLR